MDDTALAAAAAVAEGEGDTKRLFLHLRPICVDVLRSVTVENLGRLYAELSRQPRLPSPLVEYVLFPLRTAIRKLKGSDAVLLEHILKTIGMTLSKAVPGQLALTWDIFQELFMFCSVLLDDRMSDGAGFGVLTEDRTLHSLHCLQYLLTSTTDKLLYDLYSNLSAVGHCVSVMVTAVQTWESRDVRKTALLSLLYLSGLQDNTIFLFTGQGDESQDNTMSALVLIRDSMESDKLDGRTGETLASFLPGVTMGITKLLTSEPNLGQTVVTLGLLVWSRYVCLAMKDDDVEGDQGREDTDYLKQAMKLIQQSVMTQSQATPTSSTPSSEKKLRIQRSKQWRKETDKKLASLAVKMSSVLVSGGGWRRRMGVVYWAHCLLGNTYKTLVAMAPVLLEVLLIMSQDDYDQVSKTASLSLDLFSEQHSKETGGELLSVLHEKLYSLSSSLPRLMRQHDDMRKVSVLQLVAGHLRILGSQTKALTLSPPHLSHIIQALLQTIELETTPPKLQELTNQNAGKAGGWWSLSLCYKYFRNSRIEELIFKCCQLLGYHGSLSAILHHLIDLYHSSLVSGCGYGWSSELLVIISQVLIGAGGEHGVRERVQREEELLKEGVDVLVGEVLDEVTREESWRHEEEEEEEEDGKNILLHCLQLQLVSVCVNISRSILSVRMERLAYQLLTRAGSYHNEVSDHAISSLYSVASCNGISVSQLITDNSDYIVNSVCLALRGDHTHCHTPLQVLKAVMENGTEDILPLIKDSIDEMFLSLDLKLIDRKWVWSVLKSLAAALHQWTPGTAKEIKVSCCHGNREQEDFAEYFKSLRNRKEEEEEEEEEKEEDEQVEEREEKESVLSPLEQTAVDVLSRCPHYLPSSSSSSSSSSSTSSSTSSSSSSALFLSLTVLDCLRHCLFSLNHNHRILLPLVHKVWPPFLLRLSDSAFPVALRAFDVLHDLCDLCGDFVRRRVVKGVWPVLNRSLSKLSESSCNTETVYQFSVACKLQMKMLDIVCYLPVQLQVGPSELELLVHSCVPYLSRHQPLCLVNSARAALSSLLKYNPDLLWLLLKQMVPMVTQPPPHPSLHSFKFPRMSNYEQFSETVTSLLSELTQ